MNNYIKFFLILYATCFFQLANADTDLREFGSIKVSIEYPENASDGMIEKDSTVQFKVEGFLTSDPENNDPVDISSDEDLNWVFSEQGVFEKTETNYEFKAIGEPGDSTYLSVAYRGLTSNVLSLNIIKGPIIKLAIQASDTDIYANGRARIPAYISYELKTGEEIESINLLESVTMIPINNYDFNVGDTPNIYKPGLFEPSPNEKVIPDESNIGDNTNYPFITKYISSIEPSISKYICVEMVLKSGYKSDTCSSIGIGNSILIKSHRPLVWTASDFKSIGWSTDWEGAYVDSPYVWEDINAQLTGKSTATLMLLPSLPRIYDYEFVDDDDDDGLDAVGGSFYQYSQSWSTWPGVGPLGFGVFSYYFLYKGYQLGEIDASGDGIHLYRHMYSSGDSYSLETLPGWSIVELAGVHDEKVKIKFFDEYGNENSIKVTPCGDDSGRNGFVLEVCVSDFN